MFKIKKNQVIITALVAMIGVAGYLNYVDNGAIPTEVVINDDGNLSGIVPDYDLYADATEVNADVTEVNANTKDVTTEGENSQTASDSENTAGEAVFVNSSKDTSYFVQAKLEREQARAKQKDILTDVINNTNITQDKKSQAADEMLKIQQRIEKETAAEAMIEAKGFKEVYVRIDSETVDVVVNKPELTEAEIAQIEDIVKRKTGVSIDKIRISPMKEAK